MRRSLGHLPPFLNNFGCSLHLTNHTIHPKELQKLLSRIEGSEAEGLISRILLRSMNRQNIHRKILAILVCQRSITAILLHRFAVTLICRYTALSKSSCTEHFQNHVRSIMSISFQASVTAQASLNDGQTKRSVRQISLKKHNICAVILEISMRV